MFVSRNILYVHQAQEQNLEIRVEFGVAESFQEHIVGGLVELDRVISDHQPGLHIGLDRKLVRDALQLGVLLVDQVLHVSHLQFQVIVDFGSVCCGSIEFSELLTDFHFLLQFGLREGGTVLLNGGESIGELLEVVLVRGCVSCVFGGVYFHSGEHLAQPLEVAFEALYFVVNFRKLAVDIGSEGGKLFVFITAI